MFTVTLHVSWAEPPSTSASWIVLILDFGLRRHYWREPTLQWRSVEKWPLGNGHFWYSALFAVYQICDVRKNCWKFEFWPIFDNWPPGWRNCLPYLKGLYAYFFKSSLFETAPTIHNILQPLQIRIFRSFFQIVQIWCVVVSEFTLSLFLFQKARFCSQIWWYQKILKSVLLSE